MKSGLLLDTCALLWLVEKAPLEVAVLDRLDAAAAEGELWVSPMTAWEVGALAASGRLVLSMPVDAWFDAVLALPGVNLVDLTPAIYIDSSFLPGAPPGDIADRLFVATARTQSLSLVTRDKAMLAYAAEGHVRALAC